MRMGAMVSRECEEDVWRLVRLRRLLSDRMIARLVGVDRKTVAAIARRGIRTAAGADFRPARRRRCRTCGHAVRVEPCPVCAARGTGKG